MAQLSPFSLDLLGLQQAQSLLLTLEMFSQVCQCGKLSVRVRMTIWAHTSTVPRQVTLQEVEMKCNLLDLVLGGRVNLVSTLEVRAMKRRVCIVATLQNYQLFTQELYR